MAGGLIKDIGLSLFSTSATINLWAANKCEKVCQFYKYIIRIHTNTDCNHVSILYVNFFDKIIGTSL